jgi:hypothetical protein
LNATQRDLIARRKLAIAWFDVSRSAGQPPKPGQQWSVHCRDTIAAAAAVVSAVSASMFRRLLAALARPCGARPAPSGSGEHRAIGAR